MLFQKRFEYLAGYLRAHDIPLRVALWDGKTFELGNNPSVTIRAPQPDALRYLINPDLGALGQAYVEGKLDVEGEVSGVIDVVVRLARHASSRKTAPSGLSAARQHTPDLDAESIAYHYDVSNRFYGLWLDSNMVYSCGYFRQAGDSLERAQIQKIDHILHKIRLKPGDRLLDIGCGWGALVMRAVTHYGAHATGITLSRNQHDYAREKIAAAGIGDRCHVLLADYRDMIGQFDKITSVGMFEHVGLKHLREYFAKMRALLSDEGIALNHGITAANPDSESVGFGGGEFIDRYVFPNGELPHIGLALKEMSAAGLEAFDIENLRPHYAMTLRHWSRRFEAAAPEIRAEAGEKRYRIWRMYLAGCAHAFEHQWTAIHQVLAVKAGHIGQGPLPLTRDDLYAPPKPMM